MIPKHLEGTSAIEICESMKVKFRLVNKSLIQERITGRPGAVDIDKAYMRHLEMLLLLAVKDALCNCDDKLVKTLKGLDYGDKGQQAEQRAIAFLNIVLPKE